MPQKDKLLYVYCGKKVKGVDHGTIISGRTY